MTNIIQILLIALQKTSDERPAHPIRPSPVSTHRNSTGYARHLGDNSTNKHNPPELYQQGIHFDVAIKKNPHNFQGILSY